MLVDKAQFLILTGSEVIVLVGDLRALGVNADTMQHGVFTDNWCTKKSKGQTICRPFGVRWIEERS